MVVASHLSDLFVAANPKGLFQEFEHSTYCFLVEKFLNFEAPLVYSTFLAIAFKGLTYYITI